MPTDPPTAGDSPALLHCAVCGKTTACAADAVVRYAADGWPVCRGEVMSLYVLTDPPPREGR